jgi:hypothetical protein
MKVVGENLPDSRFKKTKLIYKEEKTKVGGFKDLSAVTLSISTSHNGLGPLCTEGWHRILGKITN